jgi:hypothetical protein
LADTIDNFWSWFTKHSKALRAIRSAEDEKYTELEARVATVNAGLDVEIGGADDSEDISLIITAHGNESMFPIVDALVQRAPRVDGWQIYALKPPLLEDLELQYGGGVLRLSDIWFKVVSKKKWTGKLQIQIACRNGKSEARQDAALVALESFLGERAFAASIEIENLVELPKDPAASGFLPIMRLPTELAVN